MIRTVFLHSPVGTKRFEVDFVLPPKLIRLPIPHPPEERRTGRVFYHYDYEVYSLLSGHEYTLVGLERRDFHA